MTATEASWVLAQHAACTECGTQLHRTAVPGDEWGWADEAGAAYGPASDLAFLFDPAANWLRMSDPYAYLARLGELCTEATSVKQRETTWLYERTIREYTSLKVRLDMGGYSHLHAPERTSLPEVFPYEVPEHCGWPMRLAPSGWRCRQCPHAVPVG